MMAKAKKKMANEEIEATGCSASGCSVEACWLLRKPDKSIAEIERRKL